MTRKGPSAGEVAMGFNIRGLGLRLDEMALLDGGRARRLCLQIQSEVNAIALRCDRGGDRVKRRLRAFNA